MHVKRIHDMVEKLTKCAEMEFEKGIENVDTKEMGEVVDIIKDLCEAEYYAKISKAMDEAEYGEDYDYKGAYDEHSRKGYRGQPRDSRGRYMSRRRGYDEPMGDYEMTPEMYRMYSPEYYRDMDRDAGKLYYTSNSSSGNMSSQGGSMGGSQGGSRGYSDGGNQNSRYEETKRGYMEAKNKYPNTSQEGKNIKAKKLDEHLGYIEDVLKEMSPDMSNEEKTVLSQRADRIKKIVQ